MNRTRILKSLLLAFAASTLVSFLGCSKYEILDPLGKKRTKTLPDNPNTITTPTKDLPPSAGIEAILNNVSVTKVHVNEEVTIRPTTGTADADDVGLSTACKDNPGIVKADYDLGAANAKPSVARAQCESLAIKHTFATPGDYTISLLVTDNEGQTARANMVLVVVNQGDDNTDGGFVIVANPMIIYEGGSIHFEGRCDTISQNKITWVFADGAAGEGKTVDHVYTKTGQFYVEATCTNAENKVKKAGVTIVVLQKGTGNVPPTGYPPVTPTPTQTGTQQPSQNCSENCVEGTETVDPSMVGYDPNDPYGYYDYGSYYGYGYYGYPYGF